MSLLSSVTGAATTLAAGLDAVTTDSKRSPGLLAGGAGGLIAARTPDALTARLLASPGVKAGPRAASTATSKAPAKASAKATAKAATSGKKPAASTGYGKAADFDFLKDPRLSVEEKLFRFMCAIAKRNDDEVLKKMEEMKGAGAASKSGSSGTAKKKKGFSVWSALKALVPPLGMAAQLVGDAKLKSLLTQISGPVLAAAATALGMPMLAPLALKAGPGLAGAILDGKLGGEEVAAAVGEAVGGSSTSSAGGSSGTSASSAATGKNEQVQMMELQRLVDKQKEMFAMISNVLRSQHDTRMSIIGNVR